ncbi:hypothetical protein DMH03_25885 [Amycolatopsis sp. WAC 01376]|uniref:hypothetical protein n=1 Tax=Amycolatopsis sp. WAC 01376 TaxID=2203195 RepID=UPI000F79AC7E|nr:hypothetical protein [Amycolatopsis sp. WAC 01376]RSM59282.1 hypothetical protein DMH03_25885 [Amycolatopsis sp. WAC 01376]
MDTSAFALIFGDGVVRAKLDWQRVVDECVVEERYSRSRKELGELCTVWYADESGRDAGYDHQGARPLRVSEVAITEASWPRARASMIAALRAEYTRTARPVQLTLPGYRVGDEVVLLDGNHRAAAAYLADADTRLLLYILCGPTDSGMLPDLRHYSR